MDASRTIQGLAQEHDVTIEQLLRGEGVDADVQQQAMKAFEHSRTQWAEIQRRSDFGMMPGKGRDPDNKMRKEMTDQEREDLKAQRDFSKQFSSAEQRAGDVVDRMIALATPEQAQRMDVDINRKKLIEAVTEGDRGGVIDRALRGRQEILEMGLRKGVFGDKTKIDELSAAEQMAALARLKKLDLSEAESADLSRMEKASAPLRDFGITGMDPSEITQDALRRIRQFQGAVSEGKIDDQDKRMDVTVKGNVTINEDGSAYLALEGRGLMNEVGNAVGMA